MAVCKCRGVAACESSRELRHRSVRERAQEWLSCHRDDIAVCKRGVLVRGVCVREGVCERVCVREGVRVVAREGV